MKTSYKHGHEGHRSRLKKKARNFGLKSFEPHEILELLLMYCIPYKDTNSLAHKLLDEFGSISNVVDADIEELEKFNGLGENSALFLNILSSFVEVYKSSREQEDNIKLKNSNDMVTYFRNNFEIKRKEYFYIICLNHLNRVVKKFVFDGIDDSEIKLESKDILAKLNSPIINSIVLFHTHPGGSTLPSGSDLIATKSIFDICKIINVKLLDHIILNEHEYHSLKNNHEMDSCFNPETEKSSCYQKILEKYDDSTLIKERDKK